MRNVLRLCLAVPVLMATMATAVNGAYSYQAPVVKCASCQYIDEHIDSLRNDIAIARDYIACAQTAINWMTYRTTWEYQVIYDAYLTAAELADAARLIDEYKTHQDAQRKIIKQAQADIKSLQRIASFCRDCPIPQMVVISR